MLTQKEVVAGVDIELPMIVAPRVLETIELERFVREWLQGKRV